MRGIETIQKDCLLFYLYLIAYGERVKMEVTDGDDVLACRYYIGGVYEVDEVTGEERLYIGGDAYTAPAVDICDAGGEWVLHFIGRDYLGSITHIADSEGNLVAEYSYDAWGRLRDPATHELYGSGDVPELMLWRGFTGHEWLPWFGLYNMNARLYDPVLGRFMSPDPYVQMPDNTQNLNRYLYALNNPFSYTDPSGEFIHLIIGALIGGFLNWAFNGFQFNAEGLANFGIGMAAGALSAGVGTGISSAIAGGTFGAGFIGSSTAMTAGASFWNGALIGSGAGLTNGFVSGFGTGLLNGYGIGGALKNAGIQGAFGMGAGALIGGIYSGTQAVLKGRRFFDGAKINKATNNLIRQGYKQQSTYHCPLKCAQCIDDAVWGKDFKDYFSINTGNGPIDDVQFWNTYQLKRGFSGYFGIGSYNSTPEEVFSNIYNFLNHDGFIVAEIPGISQTVNHSVVVRSAVIKTFQKIGKGWVTEYMYNVMNPATGKFTNIGIDQIIGNVFIFIP